MNSSIFVFGVAGAGALGTLVRVGLTRGLPPFALPLGTLCANTAGCFLAAIFDGMARARGWSGEWRMILFGGFLGGLTTFSGLMFETQKLAANGDFLSRAYLPLSLILGGIALWIGTAIAPS